jgi:hypothetical protein
MPDLCRHCGTELPINYDRSCPECGGKGRETNLEVRNSRHHVISLTANLIRVRESYEKNPRALTIVILVGICSPFVGLFAAGLWGVVLGLLFGVLSFFVGLRAITKVKEIDRG